MIESNTVLRTFKDEGVNNTHANQSRRYTVSEINDVRKGDPVVFTGWVDMMIGGELRFRCEKGFPLSAAMIEAWTEEYDAHASYGEW